MFWNKLSLKHLLTWKLKLLMGANLKTFIK